MIRKILHAAVILSLGLSAVPTRAGDFSAEEDLGYNEFILPVHPLGLRAPWKGVYANYIDGHADDPNNNNVNRNHQVSTESTSLLAFLAVLRGDQAVFEEMFDLWTSPAYFYSNKFQFDHWLLDKNGLRIGTNVFANASGEEVRMLEVLKLADSKFTPTGGRNYKAFAVKLADGMKGVNGGQGNFEFPGQGNSLEQDGYLLRPWFQWDDQDNPLSTPTNPDKHPVNYNNYVGYYNAATWLADPFYKKVLDYSVAVATGAQNINPLSDGFGLFKVQYDILQHQYFTETGQNECSTLAGCDIATRLGAYGHLAGNAQAVQTGQNYLDFLKKVYLFNGQVHGSYDFDSGAIVWNYSSVDLDAFFAKLAIEYKDWDLAEKIIREQILPRQVVKPSDPGFFDGYYGAFKSSGTLADATQNGSLDATAFANLESLVALRQWNDANKGSWTSTYPKFQTVATITNSDGGFDEITFPAVYTRALRILGTRRALPYGYSIFELKAFTPDSVTTDGANAAYLKPVRISSIEGNLTPGQFAVDLDSSTRWSSEHLKDPQWIEVDFGAPTLINKVHILWENAFAKDYSVQVETAPLAVNGDYLWVKKQQDEAPTGIMATQDDYVSDNMYASLYNNVLAAFCFMHEGDLARAERIFDFYDSKFDLEFNPPAVGGFHQIWHAYNGAFFRENDRWEGDNAWLLLGLNYYQRKTGSLKYKRMADGIAAWLISLQNPDGSIREGFKGEDFGSAPKNGVTTEGNFTAYAALIDHPVERNKIWNYLAQQMWIPSENRFMSGLGSNATALDGVSWSILALGKTYASALAYGEANFKRTKPFDVSRLNIYGFRDFTFTERVWLEGTGQMASAYRYLGDNVNADKYVAELEKAFVPSPAFPTAYGIPAFTNSGDWIGSSSSPFVASQAWHFMSKWGMNPFTVPPEITFTMPEQGAVLTGVTLASGTVTGGEGISSVTLYLDGNLFNASGTGPLPGGGDWSRTFTASDFSAGSHVLSAQVKDEKGNTAVSSKTVTVILPPRSGESSIDIIMSVQP